MSDSAGEVMALLEKAARDSQDLPPLAQWQPAFSGDLDMRIGRDGRWYYLGSEIKRKALVKLFSRILRREGDEYFMVTPVEKYRIRVDDAPFVAVLMDVLDHQGKQKLAFTTNVDSTVIAGKAHPIRVETDPESAEPAPYLLVRDGLEALIARSVFYRMVEIARSEKRSGGEWLVVESDGEPFPIGALQ